MNRYVSIDSELVKVEFPNTPPQFFKRSQGRRYLEYCNDWAERNGCDGALFYREFDLAELRLIPLPFGIHVVETQRVCNDGSVAQIVGLRAFAKRLDGGRSSKFRRLNAMREFSSLVAYLRDWQEDQYR